MDDPLPRYLYKETRLNLDTDKSTPTVTVQLPATGLSNQLARLAHRKQQIPPTAVAEDEATFSKRHLASSASIYFRNRNTYPRSLLWRLLNDGKLLSLTFLDITRLDTHEHEACQTLELIFSKAIRPAGLAFADYESHESFNVFVLTTSNDLYTLTLRPEFFHRSSVAEQTVQSWCKIYVSSSFNFRYPHRLAARSPLELFISLHDGGLLKLTRRPEDDGSAWVETFYNEGGWGSSIRNLIPWQGNNAVQYGNLSLEQDTLTSIALSPTTDQEGSGYLFAVALNHRLKAWNLSSGKLVSNRDMLNQERAPHETVSCIIDPAQSNLIAVVDKQLRDGDLFYLATFSPIGTGQFKFWAMIASHSGDAQLQDLYPDYVFEPPPSSSERWAMAEYRLVSGVDHRVEIWLLWKNSTSYRIETLTFDLLNATDRWRTGWITAAAEAIRNRPMPLGTGDRATGPSDEWIEYIFYPGVYSEATLATALSIYEQSLGVPSDQATRKTMSLQERVCSSVSQTVTLTQGSGDGMDFTKFRADTDNQWRRYYRLVAELDKLRGEAVGLEYDSHSGLPWVVNADGVTALRYCSESEMIWHNKAGTNSELPDVDMFFLDGSLRSHQADEIVKVTGLIGAASVFRECFSEALLRSFNDVIESETLEDPSTDVSARIRSFYEQCGFESLVSEDDYQQLMTELDSIGGVEALDTGLFEATLSILSSITEHPSCDLILTAFGERTLARGAQELIHVNTVILFDLLVLLVFIEIEVNEDDDGPATLDSPSIYLKLLRVYREHAVLGWFAKTCRSEAPSIKEHESDLILHNGNTPSIQLQSHLVSTVLQYPWIRIWRPLWLQPPRPLSICLTEYIKHALAGIGLSDPRTYNQQVMWLQRTFLRRGDIDLAEQFLRYQPNTAWSSYIKGRFYLSTGQYPVAAAHFKKAAFSLAHEAGISEIDVNESDDLLVKADAQYFSAGLPSYYLHVLGLFEHERVYSFTAEFANIGLQFTPLDFKETHKELRTELLSRAFNASLRTSSFDEAYSALLRYTDLPMQRSDLTRLISTMCDEHAGAQLIKLPFLGLQASVDEILVAKSRTSLSHYSAMMYFTALYGWRLERGDFRGAAAALHERLQRLQSAAVTEADPENKAVTQAYMALINALAALEPAEAWLLTKAKKQARDRTLPRRVADADTASLAKRQLVTIEDVRKQYQDELDRIAYIENDQFSFAGVDAMETDDVL